jgi:hypothetical protein
VPVTTEEGGGNEGRGVLVEVGENAVLVREVAVGGFCGEGRTGEEEEMRKKRGRKKMRFGRDHL